MHATIRHYQGASDRNEELTRAVCEIAVSLSKVRGFVSCLVADVEPGVLVMVSIFDDQHGLNEAHGLLEGPLAEQRGYLVSEAPQVTSGEIVFQRGL